MRDWLIFTFALALSTTAHLGLIGGVWILSSSGSGSQPTVFMVDVVADKLAPGALTSRPAAQTTSVEPEAAESKKMVPQPRRAQLAESAKLRPGKGSVASLSHSQSDSPEIGSSGGHISGPAGASALRLASAPPPPYPWNARAAGFEGTLALDLVIHGTGEIADIQLAQSSGRGDCDRSALRTVRDRWKFSPTELARTDLTYHQRILVKYQLR